MSATMTDPLALEPDSDGWRLLLVGDWSLAALPRIEAQLSALPADAARKSGLRLDQGAGTRHQPRLGAAAAIGRGGAGPCGQSCG